MRMRNTHQSFKLAKQQIKRSEAKISKLIEEQATPLQEGDAANISSITADVSPVVEEKFP